ncbi:hypothetical protein H7849_19175 [Alloacidobacterium dinghuense]|uniref:Uncharacterized protein n=1 Tax=Alloacidobacterium dinghuense TaxID=2763107 RepID=A0A7G8BF78_9BACT|nr:hypothetical protein [Alloacidobacterium dinghuense]QNI31198.1 hypothetical protein H7849_19175 [Alloacidobacterium dinghuense]
MADYRLLKEFRRLFDGKKYEHRRSNLGDFVAIHLYEDLVAVNKSERYVLSVERMSSVLNVQNKRKGIEARRGDGTFGELIDRVKSDLAHQMQNFKHRAGSSKPICFGIVGINYAAVTTSYEGERCYRTDGGKYKHPIQEAEQARSRLAEVAPLYDEFVILKYRATNEPPYSFEWVNEKDTKLDYGAALMRISNEYQRRF